ncbi:hypothetical protein SPV3_ORF30 [Sulfolobus polyhedral virus 3]|nr:hypothetical protein SPV3_ORF30 [Sulfolobus polyhedral virus 3]
MSHSTIQTRKTVVTQVSQTNVTISNPIDSSGNVKVAVENFPLDTSGNIKVDVQNFPSSQNVTVTNSSTNPVPVSVQNFPSNQQVTVANGTSNPVPVSVQNFPSSQNVNVTNTVTTQRSETLLGQALGASASANTNIFSSNLSASASGRLRILISVSSATTVSLILTPSGSTTSYSATLNGGNNLSAGAWYEFDFPVISGDQINFQVGASVTVTIRVILVAGG